MSRSEGLKSLFQLMLANEKRLDQAITKKKMVVEEAHFKKVRQLGKIRLNIMMERSEDGSLFMLIGGRIREEASDSTGERPPERRMFGSVISKLLVELGVPGSLPGATPDCLGVAQASTGEEEREQEKGSGPAILSSDREDESFFEWCNMDPESKVAEFEVKTKNSSPNGRLFLSFMSYTGMYSLCPEMASLLGVKTGTKPSLLLSIWKYVSMHRMRDPKQGDIVVCNEEFKQIFKKDQLAFQNIIESFEMLTTPLEMVCIDFAVPVLPGSKMHLAYDITMELEPQQKLYAYSDPAKISVLDKKISDIICRIERQDEKISSLQRFISNPKQFITEWILETSKDLHVIADDAYDVEGGFYVQKDIQESVYQLLQSYK